MGLRCSLLGHAFGDSVTERDRETRGAEVVITVREVQRCSRCGAEQVIAENTEVRHLGTGEKASKGDSPTEREPTAASAESEDREEYIPETEPPAPDAAESEAGSTDDGDGPAPDATEEEAEDATPGPADPPAEPGETVESESEAAADEESVDVSQYVESAEGPDAGGPGHEPELADEETADDVASEPPAAESEDVEFIDGEDSSGAESGMAESSASAEPESEPSAEAGEPAAAGRGSAEPGDEPKGGDILTSGDEDEATAGPERQRPDDRESGDQGAEAAGEAGDLEEPAEPDEEEPPEDDAVILDNEEGKAARESDVGRRELAGTGNMFDASAPEEGAGGGQGDYERDESAEDAERWPSTEQESPPDERSRRGPDAGEPVEWPEHEEPADDAADSSFQFGQDLQGDDPTSGRNPSGLTSEGPVDVDGEDDEPPRAVECPECGYSTEGVGSSLRAGDICPECHRGYLAERR